MNKQALAFVSMVALSTIPTFAHAASFAGIVEDISGVSDSKLTPSSEIKSGSQIALGTSGTLTFVHYNACTEVSVTGGTVTVTATDYNVVGGTLTENKVACPELVPVVSTTSVAGGLVMRGVGETNSLGVSPKVMLSGKSATLVNHVAFVASDKQTVQGEVVNGRVALGAGVSLKPGKYDMQLTGAEKSLTIPVEVGADAYSPLLIIAVN
jgi:hypothetical protein